VLTALYDAHERGLVSVDVLREQLSDEPKLVEILSRLHAEGLEMAQPREWFLQVLQAYLRQRLDHDMESVRSELQRWDGPAPPTDLLTRLQRLQQRTASLPNELQQLLQDEPDRE